MAGTRGKSGGVRPGAGRKKASVSEELKKLMDDYCPLDAREKIVRGMVARAEAGDVRCAAFVFDRIYGTPKNGDALAIEEKVEEELENFYALLEKNLDPQTFAKVREAGFGS